MKVTSILPLAFIAAVTGQSACPGDSTIYGYTTIADINQAIAADLSEIKAGTLPSPPYVFTLCPSTVFAADQPLTATLSGATFVCGKNGALTNSCVIQGGANQVLIQDPGVSGYTLDDVTFQGITFDGSTESSIVANASSVTIASFIDCSWSSFSGSAAIQLGSSSPKAINVVITRGSVPSGTSAAIFSNDNGTLAINELSITGFDGVNGIVTLNGGVTTIQNSDISGLGGTGLDSLLSAAGSGTTLNVGNTTIRDISLPEVLWDGIRYSEGASGVVEGSNFARTSGLQFAISAVYGSVVNVTNCVFEGNTAASGGYTSIYYALNSSRLTLLNDAVADNTGFFFYGFTGFQSYTSYENTTFVGGAVTLAVFLDQDSTFSLKNINFTDVQAKQCNPPDQQEFREDVGANCFYRQSSIGNCTGKCGIITNNTFAPTESPSAATPAPTAATVAPTTSPTVATPAPTAATVAPTISPSGATSAPTAATVAPTIAPSLATPAPIVATSAPTISPSAATATPVATTETPTQVPETVTPTTSPLAPTNAPLAPSTSVPTANKSQPKKNQKGPKAKKGAKSAKKTNGQASTPGTGKVEPNKGAGKKAKSATKAPVAYAKGKAKNAKGSGSGPGTAKGLPNKKPKLAKGNEGEAKEGLAKKATSKTGGSYGTTKSKTAKSPGIVKAGKKGSTPTKSKTEGVSKSAKTAATKATAAVTSGKKSSTTVTTSKTVGSYAYNKPKPAKKLPSKGTPKSTKGTTSHSHGEKKKATTKSGATKKAATKASHPSTPSDSKSYV